MDHTNRVPGVSCFGEEARPSREWLGRRGPARPSRSGSCKTSHPPHSHGSSWLSLPAGRPVCVRALLAGKVGVVCCVCVVRAGGGSSEERESFLLPRAASWRAGKRRERASALSPCRRGGEDSRPPFIPREDNSEAVVPPDRGATVIGGWRRPGTDGSALEGAEAERGRRRRMAVVSGGRRRSCCCCRCPPARGDRMPLRLGAGGDSGGEATRLRQHERRRRRRRGGLLGLAAQVAPGEEVAALRKSGGRERRRWGAERRRRPAGRSRARRASLVEGYPAGGAAERRAGWGGCCCCCRHRAGGSIACAGRSFPRPPPRSEASRLGGPWEPPSCASPPHPCPGRPGQDSGLWPRRRSSGQRGRNGVGKPPAPEGRRGRGTTRCRRPLSSGSSSGPGAAAAAAQEPARGSVRRTRRCPFVALGSATRAPRRGVGLLRFVAGFGSAARPGRREFGSAPGRRRCGRRGLSGARGQSRA